MFNCVGYANYRYFFNFLLYMWSGCVYVCAHSALPFMSIKSPTTQINRCRLHIMRKPRRFFGIDRRHLMMSMKAPN